MKSKDRVYNYIIDYMEKHQYSPSIREICEGTGLRSTSTVYTHLMDLDVMGKIKCDGVRKITVEGYQFCKADGKNGK